MGLNMKEMKEIRDKKNGFKKSNFTPLQADKAKAIVDYFKSIPEGKLFEKIELAYDYEPSSGEQFPTILNIRKVENGKKETLFRINIKNKPALIKTEKGWETKKDADGKYVKIDETSALRYWEATNGKLQRKSSYLITIANNIEDAVKYISATPPKQKGKNEAKPVMFHSQLDKFLEAEKEAYKAKNKDKKVAPSPSVEEPEFDF